MAEPQHSFEENPFLGYQVTGTSALRYIVVSPVCLIETSWLGALLRECRKEFGEEAPDCRRLEKARVYYFSYAPQSKAVVFPDDHD